MPASTLPVGAEDAGDVVSDEEVYERYAQKIHRFFANKVAANPKVDDLMQSTFLRYFEKRRVQTIEEPLNYLYVIARNVLFEYWRGQKRSAMHEEIGELSIADLGAGMSTLLTHDERLRIVLDSLRELRLDYQTVIELHYWERLSYKEIAAVLDENPRTIGTWLSRGRKELRRLLERKLEGAQPAASDHADQRRPGDSITGLMKQLCDVTTSSEHELQSEG